jgi:prevent-host-death family protein
VSKQHSIAEARSNLPRLVRDVAAGEPIELTRRGEPVAVLIGRKQYERLINGKRNFIEALSDFTRSVDLSELDIDPDEIFGDIRDSDPGRDVGL